MVHDLHSVEVHLSLNIFGTVIEVFWKCIFTFVIVNGSYKFYFQNKFLEKIYQELKK